MAYLERTRHSPVPHFFKAFSRIGLKHLPNGQTESNNGVENGAEAVLATPFLLTFNYFIDTFNFPLAEDIPAEDYWQVVSDKMDEFRNLINQKRNGQMQVVVGGDNSVSLASVLARLDQIKDPAKLGYLHFDSHGDCNLLKESPSGNFHGMYVRALLGEFDVPQIEKLAPQKIPPKNALFIGNLDLDWGEVGFFSRESIQTLGLAEIQDMPRALARVYRFISHFKYLHVNFDIDVFDKGVAPATGIPAEKGFPEDEMMQLLRVIAQHPNLSLDLSEVNPAKKGATKTVAVAQEVLLTLINQ